MAYVHVAHDVRLGDRTVLANGVTLAGHVHVGDWAVIGGLSGVHQFVHIGAHAMIGFQAHVARTCRRSWSPRAIRWRCAPST